MILVDTSVLISYFKGQENEATEKFEKVLVNNIPFGINKYIYQELLQGVSNEKDFKKLKEYLETQKFYDLKNGLNSYEESAKLYYQCRKSGVTIRSTIDLIIAQTAIENNLLLLHNDNDFTNMTKIITELKIY